MGYYDEHPKKCRCSYYQHVGFWTEVPAYGLFCLSVSHFSVDNGESNCISNVVHVSYVNLPCIQLLSNKQCKYSDLFLSFTTKSTDQHNIVCIVCSQVSLEFTFVLLML